MLQSRFCVQGLFAFSWCLEVRVPGLGFRICFYPFKLWVRVLCLGFQVRVLLSRFKASHWGGARQGLTMLSAALCHVCYRTGSWSGLGFFWSLGVQVWVLGSGLGVPAMDKGQLSLQLCVLCQVCRTRSRSNVLHTSWCMEEGHCLALGAIRLCQ